MSNVQKIWHNDAKWVITCTGHKRFNIKILYGEQPMHLKEPFCIKKYHDFSILKMVAVRHLGFLKLKFSKAIHLRDMFCIIMPISVEIGHTVLRHMATFFLEKCKTFPDDCT